MPNNKKNKKNKEKKAARAGAAVGPTAPAQQAFFLPPCRHNPASCDKCIMAYPSGCLHSLRQDERMSPEINNEVMPFFERLITQEPGTWLWDLPENASFANERTLYGMLKCGSHAAQFRAVESDDMSSLDEGQASIRALNRAFDGYYDCYYRLVYIMNELSPCNCLEREVIRAQAEGGESVTLGCSNDDCDVKESSNIEPLRRCAGCKIAHYCSRHCYKDHWRGHTTSTESSHKIACKAIQELKSLLAGGGEGEGGISHTASSSGDGSS